MKASELNKSRYDVDEIGSMSACSSATVYHHQHTGHIHLEYEEGAWTASRGQTLEYLFRRGMVEEEYETDPDEYFSARTPEELPDHLSPGQYQRILHAVQICHDKTAELLIALMYEYGLRIEECLGLTYEDVYTIETSRGHAPVLAIRNRLSDNTHFQRAKWKPRILDPKEYRRADYRNNTDIVHISTGTYYLILNYIRHVHQDLMENFPENFATGYADLVSPSAMIPVNHYLFLNDGGELLTLESWNTSLRQYFVRASIFVKPKWKHNLSQLFRNGCAAVYAHYQPEPLSISMLASKMRYHSLAPALAYYSEKRDLESISKCPPALAEVLA